jgi:mRNA interferase MazF
MPDDVRRGEIYWVDWNPSRGSEQSGIRPALIIQNDVGNKLSPNTIVASITRAPKKLYPFLIHFTKRDSNSDISGTADLASILTISKTRLVDKRGELSPQKMKEVDEAVKSSLAL